VVTVCINTLGTILKWTLWPNHRNDTVYAYCGCLSPINISFSNIYSNLFVMSCLWVVYSTFADVATFPTCDAIRFGIRKKSGKALSGRERQKAWFICIGYGVSVCILATFSSWNTTRSTIHVVACSEFWICTCALSVGTLASLDSAVRHGLKNQNFTTSR